MKKILSVILILVMFMSNSAFADDSYSDYPAQWAKTEILKASAANIVNEKILCDYNRDITREEFCELVVNTYEALGGNFLNIPISAHFSDTNNWDVLEAYAIGVVSGISETEFAPHEKITREQMAVMMNRLIELMNYAAEPTDLNVFNDFNQISSWATDSLSILAGSGIIKGISDAQIAPLQNVSREQAIVMIWRLYELLGGEDVLIYEETTPDILTELGIITDANRNNGEYITTLEVLKTIKQAKVFSSTVRLADWYRGDTLAEMDYLDDDTKLLLLELCNYALTYNEITTLDLDSDITNYEALLYVTRMVGDTYGCTDSVTDIDTDKENIYEIAYEKGLIQNTDTINAEVPMTREEFYNILHRALFAKYHRGGIVSAQPYRLIDRYKNQNIKPQPVETKEPEKVELAVDAVIEDDLSVKWTLPDEYSFIAENEYSATTYLIGKDGTEEMQSISSARSSGYDGYEIVKYLISGIDGDWVAIRCEYSKALAPEDNKEYYFDIDISNIKIVVEGDEINPGIYTRYNRSWTAKEISLADGENFEEGCYYILKDYDKKYRKEEFNSVSYEVFMAEETGNTFIAPTNRSFGVNYLGEIHIQKVKIKKSDNGYVLSVTPESTNIFKIEESLFENSHI
ncbi:MAG: S-layer homology domain-containing protein [Oscillospiraceae bacterium]|nr:S-layer homology domain-containing protein [Oscillospiraceae bacterium]